jgi:endoglucanase
MPNYSYRQNVRHKRIQEKKLLSLFDNFIKGIIMNTNQINWKRKLMLIALILAVITSCKQSISTTTMSHDGFEIKRGVNLSHWLSQDFGWVPKYTIIKEEDIRFINSIGYDHVRIPIDEKEMWNEKGEAINEAFKQLKACLNWCQKYNLRAIVDLHIIRSHHFNAENEGGKNTLWEDPKAQDHLVDIWKELSDSLHEYPDSMVAYEILNEVVAPEHDDWNNLLNRTVTEIRKKEPERVLIAGPNLWQKAPNLKFLKLPENDKNIILSFHTYTPLAFTHHKANWTPVGLYDGPVHYPGQIITDEDYKKYVDTTNKALVEGIADAREYYDKKKLFEVFESGIAFAKSKNLQLYCGEFGCLPTVERKDRLQYYSDIISAFEENDIAWCNWEYKGDFGIYHFDLEKMISMSPDTVLIKILFQTK